MLSLSLLLRFPLRCTGSFLRRVRNNLIWNTAGTERPWMFFTWHHYKDIIKSSQRACCARLGLRGRGWSRVGIGCQSRIIKVYPWIRSWILSSVTESKSLCICSFFHARRPQLHPTPTSTSRLRALTQGGGHPVCCSEWPKVWISVSPGCPAHAPPFQSPPVPRLDVPPRAHIEKRRFQNYSV